MHGAILESFANSAQTTLSAAITSTGDLTISVASASGFPSSGQFRIVISLEILLVTGGHGTTTWVVERAQEGTVATTHSNGATVTHILTKEALRRVATNPIGDENVKGQGVFLMSCHQSVDELPYLMGSNDGKSWTLLRMASIIGSPPKRDPSIIQYKDKYWLAVTDSTNTYFTVYSSPDLFEWSEIANVSMTAISLVFRVWAPEWFIDDDGTIHVFVAVSTNSLTNNFQIYRVNPTNAGMTAWSSPTLITITGQSNVIDAFAIKKAGTYYLWYKEETADFIHYASSSTLAGPYTDVETGDWASWGSPIEAPCLVKIDETTWRIYLNEHSGFDSVAVYYSESTDDWATWSAKVAITTPWIVAHPTVIRVRDFGTLRNMLATFLQSRKQQGAIVTLAATQIIANNTGVAISFTAEAKDDGDFWAVGQPTRLLAPVTGWYQVGGSAEFAANATGKRVIDVRRTLVGGGTEFYGTQDRSNLSGSDIVTFSTTVTIWMEAGDHAEIVVFQNSGGNLNAGPCKGWILLLK